ncbi:hypothetical protein EYW49_11120 [Siculibacillus lacustris]|uniref:BrnA antitoxin family protein n=1 Tax=Siculibacillus lacustris TaxID=1549641 RepID=A0A4Q9VPU4_9HYPH|nr:hypothetical protein EYW49_11120 [Siculibacillus lacustris]
MRGSRRGCAEEPSWRGSIGEDAARCDARDAGVHLDDDILAFFREAGPGYQKRINAVLRAYMTHARARTPPDSDVAE